jgi:hypothetical protein
LAESAYSCGARGTRGYQRRSYGRPSARFAADGRQVRCKRFDHNDGSLTLDDVDYECEVGDGEITVWVGSNAKRITGFNSSGP